MDEPILLLAALGLVLLSRDLAVEAVYREGLACLEWTLIRSSDSPLSRLRRHLKAI
jgi:hypothetical protein